MELTLPGPKVRGNESSIIPFTVWPLANKIAPTVNYPSVISIKVEQVYRTTHGELDEYVEIQRH